MSGAFRAAINKAIPWLLFGSVMIPAACSAVVGVLVLAFWRQGEDIALGVLAIALGLAVLAGTIISLALLSRQNRMIRRQSEFVAHVSHELRTPLTSIIMGIATLRENRFDSDDERIAFLEMIDRETSRLATLVEQAIGYQIATGHGRPVDEGRGADGQAELDSGAGRIGEAGNREPFPVTRAIAEILSPYLTRTDTRDCIRFVSTCLETDLVQVDADAFRGAVNNLVNNALTHGRASQERPVVVRLGTEDIQKTSDDASSPVRDGWIVVEVADRGPGVERHDRNRIFDKYRRGTGTSDGGVPGLGLGLAIVLEFAGAADGKVAVGETPGGGATFTLTIPRYYAGRPAGTDAAAVGAAGEADD